MYILLITSEGLRILKAAPLEQRLVIRLCRRVFKHAPVGPLVLRQSLARKFYELEEKEKKDEEERKNLPGTSHNPTLVKLFLATLVALHFIPVSE